MIFLTETKCKIRFIYVGFNCKRKKWGKKCLEIMTIKGGRAVGLTPNGKKHLKFPFWLCEYLPNLVMSLIRLHSTLCWLIPDWFRRKAHYFTQCLLLMSQGSLFNYILTLYKIQVMEDLGNKKNGSSYDHIIPFLCSWYSLLIIFLISAVQWWTQKEGFLSTEMELSSGFPL